MKHLGIMLTKDVQVLYAENHNKMQHIVNNIVKI